MKFKPNQTLKQIFAGEDTMNKIQSAAAALGSIGGKSTSPAKQAASRENGKHGGRPATEHTYSFDGQTFTTYAEAVECARQIGFVPLRTNARSSIGGPTILRDGEPYQSVENKRR